MTDHPIFPYLVIILALSVSDWALTLDAVNGGWATELNPIGRWTLDQGTAGSLLIRLCMVVPGLVLLWLMRKRAWARVLAISLAWMYFILLGWHVYGRVAYFG